MGSISRVVRQLSGITDGCIRRSTIWSVTRTRLHRIWSGSRPQLAFAGADIPLLLKGLARVSSEGPYGMTYACDLNALGFFPGLNDVTPVIVNTRGHPGSKAQHSPRCGNMANG